jgi:HTH-type transcriptional regulator / antitoxin HipB
MQTLQELGQAASVRRRALGLRQAAVAQQAGVTAESLSRFERGRSAEFGARKLLAVLAALGMELDFAVAGQSGTLDELRRERQRSGADAGVDRS